MAMFGTKYIMRPTAPLNSALGPSLFTSFTAQSSGPLKSKSSGFAPETWIRVLMTSIGVVAQPANAAHAAVLATPTAKLLVGMPPVAQSHSDDQARRRTSHCMESTQIDVACKPDRSLAYLHVPTWCAMPLLMMSTNQPGS